MGRQKDEKTETLYVYVKPENRDFVTNKKQEFKTVSHYIDDLLDKERRRSLRRDKKKSEV